MEVYKKKASLKLYYFVVGSRIKFILASHCTSLQQNTLQQFGKKQRTK